MYGLCVWTVGSVHMRSTQQEHVWFMCVGSVHMSTQQEHVMMCGLCVWDQSA